MINLAPMKNCPGGGVQGNLNWMPGYMELWNACIISLVFIVLNVRDGTDSKYPSTVFLSIVIQ